MTGSTPKKVAGHCDRKPVQWSSRSCLSTIAQCRNAKSPVVRISLRMPSQCPRTSRRSQGEQTQSARRSCSSASNSLNVTRGLAFGCQPRCVLSLRRRYGSLPTAAAGNAWTCRVRSPSGPSNRSHEASSSTMRKPRPTGQRFRFLDASLYDGTSRCACRYRVLSGGFKSGSAQTARRRSRSASIGTKTRSS